MQPRTPSTFRKDVFDRVTMECLLCIICERNFFVAARDNHVAHGPSGLAQRQD